MEDLRVKLEDAEIKIAQLTETISRLESLSGQSAQAKQCVQEQNLYILEELKAIRSAMDSESDSYESNSKVNEEVAKLKDEIRRKDYRILHLLRALED